MTTRILLLRHAESADPTVFHGAESDVELSPRGVEQARLVATHLAAFSPVAVISSAMRRARATAAPIALACSRELLIEPDLHERRVGRMSGQSTSAPDSPWPPTLAKWMAGETSFAPEGMESFDDIRGRVLPVWHRLAERYRGQTIVVVAHGIVCKVVLLSILPGYSAADWKRLGHIRNVGIHELLLAGQAWRAVRIDDVGHLG